LRAWVVSAGFFDALGAQPSAGRLFSDDEYLEGNEAVVMLSHGTWLARFGGDPSILGQELVLDDLPHRVVGVLSADFRYPSRAEAWTPRPRRSWDAAQRSRPTMRTVGKLGPGTSEADARRELDRLASVLGDRYPVENASLDIGLVSLRDEIVGDVEAPLMILFATVVLVLLVASANVAGLQLTRGITQTRALAVRAALGASKARLLRISIIESLLLAAIGGALGVGLAYGGIALIEALGPTHLPRIDELRIDAVVLGFAVLSAIAGSLAAGTLPALVASGTAPSLALAAGGRGGSIGRKGRRMQDALVVGELAVAVSLAVGAGLLVRSFTASMDIDLGFETSGVVAAQVWAYGEGHRSDFEYFDRSLRALRAVPGFEAVGVTSDLPLASDGPLLARRVAVDVELPRAESAEQRVAYMSVMDEAFLGALGIDLVRGRPFREDDDVDGMPVALINETFARTFLGGQDPTGQPIQVGFRDDGAREIVGVVADVRRRGSELPPLPEVYLPHRQVPLNGLTMVVRADLAPASVVSLVRETLMQVDPGQAIWANQPMADLLTDRIRQRRFNTVLLGAFSLIALGLAAVGLYGLIAFQVQRRTREFGIRRALGCTAHGVIADVLRRGALLAGMGLAVGAVGATVVALGLRSMLFGVTALDPTTVVGVSLVFSAITVIAGLGAARRAVRVSPSIAVTAAE
ncbi:MAG: ABC transporter permease, partial [Gemmatimonadetes bacterium]|nr:ABC transporter permease [Gemmatimonadota bacterium]